MLACLTTASAGLKTRFSCRTDSMIFDDMPLLLLLGSHTIISSMTTIKRTDLVQSVADALQFISYYHPADYIRALGRAYEREQSPAAKDAIAQILTNSRLCAEGKRPVCQDTGIVNVFVKAGLGARWDTARSLQEMVDEGVRRGYGLVEIRLRPSIVADPLFLRRNTGDKTPAVVHAEVVGGDKVGVTVAAKGGGF